MLRQVAAGYDPNDNSASGHCEFSADRGTLTVRATDSHRLSSVSLRAISGDGAWQGTLVLSLAVLFRDLLATYPQGAVHVVADNGLLQVQTERVRLCVAQPENLCHYLDEFVEEAPSWRATMDACDLRRVVDQASVVAEEILLRSSGGVLLVRTKGALADFRGAVRLARSSGSVHLGVFTKGLLDALTPLTPGNIDVAATTWTRNARPLPAIAIQLGAAIRHALEANPPLETAAAIGDTVTLRELTAEGPTEASTPNWGGMPPLSAAAQRGHLEAMELLLKAGADPDELHQSGLSPLHYAAANGHYAAARLLLDAGARILVGRESLLGSPLHIAAGRGDARLTALLLARGADPNARSAHILRPKPLHVAVKNRHLSICELLTEHGAEVDYVAMNIARDAESPDILRHLAAKRAAARRKQNRLASEEAGLPFEGGDAGDGLSELESSQQSPNDGHPESTVTPDSAQPYLVRSSGRAIGEPSKFADAQGTFPFDASDVVQGILGLEALASNEDEAQTVVAAETATDEQLDDLLRLLDARLRQERPQRCASIVARFERSAALAELLKRRRAYTCQLCGFRLRKADGGWYAEAHHLEFLSEGGMDCLENVVVVCANCHKRLHYSEVRFLDRQSNRLRLSINGDTHEIDTGVPARVC